VALCLESSLARGRCRQSELRAPGIIGSQSIAPRDPPWLGLRWYFPKNGWLLAIRRPFNTALTQMMFTVGMPDDIRTKTLHLPGGYRAPRAIAEDPPPAIKASLKAARRIRNVYWCAFPRDMRQPEFWKTRPMVIMSHHNQLTGPVLVVPMTTKAQHGDKWAIRLGRNPNPRESCDVWVVCNHLYTVGCSRLSQFDGVIPRLTPDEFRPIHELVLKWIPALIPVASGG